MSINESSEENGPNLGAALAALDRDYSKLAPRIRSLDHSITCECQGVTIRLNFPSFRQGQPTVHELVETIFHYLTPFCLPRSQITAVRESYGKVSVGDFELAYSQLSESARALFKRANEATNRNGEAGELLLYLLTEWILDAPQLIAKMSLKTNRDMPIHGADGVHVRYCVDTGRLLLYWGESKLYADVGAAISAAVTSIGQALQPDKLQHEIELVQRNISFSGLDNAAKEAILRYLDPFEEAYNQRHDVTTCLIGFDFDAFAAISPADADGAEAKFILIAREKLEELTPSLAKAIKTANLDSRPIEIFFFPVPSVQDLRDMFQAKIGWKQ